MQNIRQRRDLHIAGSHEHLVPPHDTRASRKKVVVSRSLDHASEISAQTNERAKSSTFYSDAGEKPQSWILRAYRWTQLRDPNVAVFLILCIVVGALLGAWLWTFR